MVSQNTGEEEKEKRILIQPHNMNCLTKPIESEMILNNERIITTVPTLDEGPCILFIIRKL